MIAKRLFCCIGQRYDYQKQCKNFYLSTIRKS
jgi:hypothetical protein